MSKKSRAGEASSPARNHDFMTRSTARTGATILLFWTIILLGLSFVPTPSWAPRPVGDVLEHLGQFGDAFAPVTAFFALMAAVGAWRSYGAQREQLDDERERTRMQRFDELFFRLLAYYDERARREIYQGRTARTQIRKFHDSLQGDPGQLGEYELWRLFLYEGSELTTMLAPLAAQIPAVMRWLQSSCVDEPKDYAALLYAHLSEGEVWFWQRSIAATRDSELIAFAVKWGFYGPDSGMTAGQARAFAGPP